MKSSAGRSRAGKGGAPGAGETEAKPRSRAGRTGASASRPAVPTGTAALIAAFARGEFPMSLYLDGPCEPVKAALLAELRAAWAGAVPASPLATVFRAAETGVEQLLASWQGASLFSPRDLVIVLDLEDWTRSEKKVGALADVVARAATPSTLALVESASDTDRKSLEPLRRACATRVTADVPRAAELVAWGARRFEREGVAAEDGVLALLAEACEADALAFFSELDKLCTWAARDGRLALDEVRTLLRPVVGSELIDYLEAVAQGDAARATQRLGRLLAAGEGEGGILFGLSNLVSGALGGWTRYRDLSPQLRRRMSPVQLSRALDACYRAEAAWKGGRADAVAVLEQTTRALCHG